MTFATKSTRHAFTLIELLVVIGIIGVLIGILAPAASLVLRKANAARVRADLNTIATALEAYKNDFQGNYPQVLGINPETGAQEIGTGAHVLCRALFGLGPAYPLSASDWGGADGAEGPGFRLRRTINDDAHPTYSRLPATPPSTPPWIWTLTASTVFPPGIPDSFGGKVYGPYLQPENFRFDTTPPFSDLDRIRILDHTGNPILYYGALTQNVNMASTGAPLLVWNFNSTLPSVTTPPARPPAAATVNYRPLFNVEDNLTDQDATPNPQLDGEQMLAMLGDYNTSNRIEAATGEPAANSPPFLLWARGPDNKWGPQDVGTGNAAIESNRRAVEKCDDITNFR